MKFEDEYGALQILLLPPLARLYFNYIHIQKIKNYESNRSGRIITFCIEMHLIFA